MDNWVSVADSQKRVYEAAEAAIESVENHDMPLYNLCGDFKNVKGLGEPGGVRFLIAIATGKSGSGGNNGGVEQNETVTRIDEQGAVAVVENSEMTDMTDMLKYTGTGAGVWEDETTRRIRDCTENLAKRMQLYLNVSHGTGRVCVVDADTNANVAFVASVKKAYCYGIAGLELNGKIDIYSSDTNPAADEYLGVLVESIDPVTGTVTTDESMTLTEGWGVYLEGRFGLGINGLRNLVDNGTNSLTIHGLTRLDHPQALNSIVIDAYSGANRVELSQDMLDKAVNQVDYNGGKVEFFYGNPGVNNTFNRANVTLRQYNNISGKGAFKQELGQRDLGSYTHKGRTIPWYEDTDPNSLPGMLYGLSKNILRKYVASPMKFMMDGGSMWQTAVGSSGRPITGYQAVCKIQMNAGIQKPSWAMAINGLRDTFTGRDV